MRVPTSRTPAARVTLGILLAASCTTSPGLGPLTGRWEGRVRFPPDCIACPVREGWTFQLQEGRGGRLDGTAQSVTVRVTEPDTVDLLVVGEARANGYVAVSLSCQRWEVCTAAPTFYGGLRVGADSTVFYTREFGELPAIELRRVSTAR